jgi:hypothetical protein
VLWIRIRINVIPKLDPDPDQSDKLDPDPRQFTDDKPKCMENEPIRALFSRFCAFILEARIRNCKNVKDRIRIRSKVTSRIRIRIKVKSVNRIRSVALDIALKNAMVFPNKV